MRILSHGDEDACDNGGNPDPSSSSLLDGTVLSWINTAIPFPKPFLLTVELPNSNREETYPYAPSKEIGRRKALDNLKGVLMPFLSPGPLLITSSSFKIHEQERNHSPFTTKTKDWRDSP